MTSRFASLPPARSWAITPAAWRAVLALAVLGLLSACAGRSGYRSGYGFASPQRHYAAPGPPGDPWGPYIKEASRRFSIPESWIRGVMHQESGGHEYIDGQLTTSSAGAMGLMQLMPATYADMRNQYGLGNDPYDPHDNIMAGTAYIRQMYDRYGSPGFLAAYNAGPGRVDSYLAGESNLPSETVNYLASVAPHLSGNATATGPLAVYAENTSNYANGVPASLPPETPPQTAPLIASAQAATLPRGGCDPNAAYDPYRPCGPVPLAVAKAAPNTNFDALAANGVSVPLTPAATPEPSQPQLPPPQPQRQYASALAYQPPPAPLPPPPQPHFQLANARPGEARTAPAVVTGGGGAWAIQVGAFGSPSQARLVAEEARLSVGGLLNDARAEEPPTTPFGHTVLYRARLTGLSSNTASAACARLSQQGTACAVIRPGGHW